MRSLLDKFDHLMAGQVRRGLAAVRQALFGDSGRASEGVEQREQPQVPREFRDLVPFAFEGGEWVPGSVSSQIPPQLTERKGAASFTLLTWNVWFGKLEAEARYRAIISRIETASPDFICLQEVTIEFIWQIQRDPYIQENYFSSEDGNQGTLETYGVLLLWKKVHSTHLLRLYHLPSRYGRRLAIVSISFDFGSIVSP